jgi:hypothetical protein
VTDDIDEQIIEALKSVKLHNNSKRRRFKRDLAHTKGPSGVPDPFGNRAHRRSKEGKREISELLKHLRGGNSLREEGAEIAIKSTDKV